MNGELEQQVYAAVFRSIQLLVGFHDVVLDFGHRRLLGTYSSLAGLLPNRLTADVLVVVVSHGARVPWYAFWDR